MTTANENSQLFPPAEEFRQERFNIKAWVEENRSSILRELRKHGRAVVNSPHDDEKERGEITRFFESLGYKVNPGRDYRNETDGSLIITP
ncbi:hypothetical protein C5B42_03605 [Candidatus Cerribacteria bacterium 'Amazon FNV 2010 28 9']|uniref:Uncharacterized protein n=1 Tax=Candidatus Cerribacteria bacterium 'Amazon FNV 2010 28 9' TaxID=2081795 RepID=A0A317JPJ2_9BACT|nr:MAG: hypothetical protein C5B42_03605 [Candidatus Cerribacteria bacterium 'Amazon FNV 2010 28 9']